MRVKMKVKMRLLKQKARRLKQKGRLKLSCDTCTYTCGTAIGSCITRFPPCTSRTTRLVLLCANCFCSARLLLKVVDRPYAPLTNVNIGVKTDA